MVRVTGYFSNHLESPVKPASRPLLFAALILAAVNLRPGITSFAPLIERIANELSLSRSVMSLSTALPVLCMGLLAPFAPRLAVRFGLERTITFCLGLITLALALRLAGDSSVLLISTAALLGAGIAVAGPLLSGFIKRHFVSGVGQVLAWYSLSMAIGGAAGAVLTFPLMELFGLGWVGGLSVWAVPALLGVLLWLLIPNTPEVAAQKSAAVESVGLPWNKPRAWLISGFFAIQAGLFYALATWAVARYHEAGLSMNHSNALFGMIMLMGLPSAFIMPWLAQRFDSRPQLLILCGVVTSVCLAMISFAPLLVPEVWAVALGLSLSGSFSLSLVLPLYEVNTPLAVSRWTAMMLFMGYSVGSLTPVLSGLARDLSGSYQLPFVVLMCLAMLMTVLAILMLKGRKPAD